MSEFSRDIEDYLTMSIDEVEGQFGEAAADYIREYAEETLEALFDAIDYAESEEEREFAIEQLEDFTIEADEIETRAEEAEFEELLEYMSQSYKDDRDKIDRYIELKARRG